jgi:hypothetical protein
MVNFGADKSFVEHILGQVTTGDTVDLQIEAEKAEEFGILESAIILPLKKAVSAGIFLVNNNERGQEILKKWGIEDLAVKYFRELTFGGGDLVVVNLDGKLKIVEKDEAEELGLNFIECKVDKVRKEVVDLAKKIRQYDNDLAIAGRRASMVFLKFSETGLLGATATLLKQAIGLKKATTNNVGILVGGDPTVVNIDLTAMLQIKTSLLGSLATLTDTPLSVLAQSPDAQTLNGGTGEAWERYKLKLEGYRNGYLYSFYSQLGGVLKDFTFSKSFKIRSAFPLTDLEKLNLKKIEYDLVDQAVTFGAKTLKEGIDEIRAIDSKYGNDYY